MTTNGDKVPHSSSASSLSSRSSIPTTQVSILLEIQFCSILVCMYAQCVLHVHHKLFSFQLSYLLCTCTSRCSCRRVHVLHVNSILEDELIARACHRYVYVVCKHCASQTTCKDMDRISKLCATASNITILPE